MERLKYYYYKFIEQLSYRYQKLASESPELLRRIKIALIVILVLLIAFVVYWLYFRKEKASEEKQDMISVKVKKLTKQDYIDNYTVMGSIKGAIENELRFELEGQLASYNYKEGARIKEGEVICSLDPKDAITKAEFAKSKYRSEVSAYNSAKEKYKVYEELFSMKALSESKLYEAKYEI